MLNISGVVLKGHSLRRARRPTNDGELDSKSALVERVHGFEPLRHGETKLQMTKETLKLET